MLNEVNNSFKVVIDNKKDEQKTIQLFFFEKNPKKLAPRGKTGHSISWS